MMIQPNYINVKTEQLKLLLNDITLRVISFFIVENTIF